MSIDACADDLPSNVLVPTVFRLSVFSASRAHIVSSGRYGSYGFVGRLTGVCGVIERAELREQVADALDSGDEPLVVEGAVVCEREGGPAEIGEGEGKLVLYLRSFRAREEGTGRMRTCGSRLFGGAALGPVTVVAAARLLGKGVEETVARDRLMAGQAVGWPPL